jgi:hypothetical protein
MYRSTKEKSIPGSAICPECMSTSVLYKGGGLVCRNCDHVIYSPKKKNKYGAIRTVARDGIKRDSKFEANVADELYMRKAAGDILDYDTQYKVEMPIYNVHGREVMKVSHKIDFRIHHKDGSYELYEAKGVETSDYKWRRRLLELLWLPEHPDHIYTVRKQGYRRKKK